MPTQALNGGKPMHIDFLKNIQVNGTPLPDAVIDAILAEHNRDLEAAKANPGANGGTGGKTFTQEEVNRIVSERLAREREKANTGLKDDERAQMQGEIERLQGELSAQGAAHKQQLADLAFDHILDTAITSARGRNGKAIRALLDIDTLKGSQDHGAAIKAALGDLQRDNGYLFDSEPVPPPYSAGTGSAPILFDGSFADAFKPPKI